MDTLRIYFPGDISLTAIVLDDNIPSLVLGPSEDISESLRGMHWNQRINIQYLFRNEESVQEQIQEISLGRLMHIIGTDYRASGPPKIYSVNSVDGLFNGLGE